MSIIGVGTYIDLIYTILIIKRLFNSILVKTKSK